MCATLDLPDRGILRAHMAAAADESDSSADHLHMAYIRAASRAVLRAATITRRLQPATAGSAGAGFSLSKDDLSPVTIGDLAVQALIVMLLKRDPELLEGGHAALPVIGEEDSSAVRENGSVCSAVIDAIKQGAAGCTYLDAKAVDKVSVCEALDAGTFDPTASEEYAGRYFCLDPIDGTKGFLRGKDHQYSIGLGFVDGARAIAGVIACPNLGFDHGEHTAGGGEGNGTLFVGSLATASGTPQCAQFPIASTLEASQVGSSLLPVPVPVPVAPASERKRASTAGRGDEEEKEYEDGLAAAGTINLKGDSTHSDDLVSMLPGGQSCAPLPSSSSPSPSPCPLSAFRLVESFESGHSSHGLSEAVATSLGLPPAEEQAPVRIDSMAKYGLLARGQAQLYLRFPQAGYREKVWDHAPGAAVLQAAGGCVTDGEGRELDFSHGRRLPTSLGVVASAGPREVHAEVIRHVRRCAQAEGKGGDSEAAEAASGGST